MSTVTAPVAGPGRTARLSVTRFIRRAFTLNIGGEKGSRERRAFHRFALVIPVANFWGAADVFLFLWFVAPLPANDNLGQARMVNLIAFAVCIVVTFIVCGSMSNKCAGPVANWLDS